MNELEQNLIKGINSSRRLGLIFLGISALIIIAAWFMISPHEIDSFEWVAMAYTFGCGLGTMAGMDQVRCHVKEFLQTSRRQTQ